MTPLSRRVRSIGPSANREINETAAELSAAGTHVHDLSLGDAGDAARAGASEAPARTSLETGAPGGIELRRAITRSLNRTFYDQTGGNEYLPRYGPDEIIVGSGAKQLQQSAIQALCDPGDEVLLFAPYGGAYPDMVRLADATPVVVSSDPESGFIPSIDAIGAAITERTRLVFLNSSGNPGGRVWTRSQVGELCELILAHSGVYLLSDEIYSDLVFCGARHISPVTHSEPMRGRTILTGGLSDPLATGGWTVGHAAVADEDVMARMRAIAANVTPSPPSIASDAAVRSLEDRARMCRMRLEFGHRAQHFNRRLNAMGLPTLPTQGGVFALADVSSLFGADVHGRTLGTSQDVATALLADARVASVAGDDFGAPDHIRFSFVLPLAALDAACDAIEAFVLRHRSAGLSGATDRVETGVAREPQRSSSPPAGEMPDPVAESAVTPQTAG